MKKFEMINMDYFCTWTEQGKVRGNLPSRDAINEETVFGADGWIHYYPEVRKDMYFLIDDGWDVDYHTVTPDDFSKFGSHDVNVMRFPSFHGTPEEKLGQFVKRVKAAGWRGLGIWIPTQAYGSNWEKSVKETTDYWRAMLERSKRAGVSYWKVDWGKCAYNVEDRRLITELAHEIYPELIVEHAICMYPINHKDSDCGRFKDDEACQRGMELAAFSDVLRTYDVTNQLAISTTLDRVSCVLPGANAFFNCESTCYIGAGLGFAVGIMERSGIPAGKHAAAAVRWHQIAPPFVGGETYLSEDILTDYFEFNEGSTWAAFLFGRKIYQSAPAVISRNTPLPEIRSEGETPFIVASLNPSGAYTIAALERMLGTEQIFKADVTCMVESNPKNIGIFGKFECLTFLLGAIPVSVIMKNLITEETIDVSDRIVLDRKLKISGDLFRLFENCDESIQPAVYLTIIYE